MGEAIQVEAREWELRLEELDGEELERFGTMLDKRPAIFGGRTVGMELAEKLRIANAVGNAVEYL